MLRQSYKQTNKHNMKIDSVINTELNNDYKVQVNEKVKL